jgi:hypothetical protein
MSTADVRVQQLRGALAGEEPGARGIERVARNPGCLRLRAVTIAGITPATAAKLLGLEDREGQSPFALSLGQQFERRMLQNGAAEVLTLYRNSGRLGVTESKVVNLDELASGPSLKARRRRESETLRLLRAKIAGDPAAPNLIVRPRLNISLVGVPHPIEPDYLVAADADRFYLPGELKSYPDRDGKTAPADIRSACRQAAVGAVALLQWLRSQGLDPNLYQLDHADLVLRVTGLFMGTLRHMSIVSEIDSIQRAIAEAPTNLDELEDMLGAGASLDDPAVLGSVPNAYRSNCKEHCALWEHCREQALAARQPNVLGDVAAEQLAAAGSIDRAIELMTGTGAAPRNAGEANLARTLSTANEAFRRVANV